MRHREKMQKELNNLNYKLTDRDDPDKTETTRGQRLNGEQGMSK